MTGAQTDAAADRLEMTATVIHRIEDGRIAEKWSDKDLFGFLQQLGMIPAPDTAAAP